MEIPGYTIIEQVGETLQSVVFRAKKDGHTGTCIVKTLKTVEPTREDIVRLKHEFELIRSLSIDGIVRVYDIIESFGGLALVLEDFQAVSLKDYLQKELKLDEFLELADHITEILGNLHARHVTHMDIKPGNILYNARDHVLKLTDFGIAAEITRSNEEIYNPAVIEGTLVYISPEQTGRMNCPVDYRTDLYSLGVTFYEMLLRRVPFVSSDPMEVIHAHIAKRPVAPSFINPGIPGAVSDIIMKLLAKTPEERYQNGFGVMADIRECRRRLQNTGKIEPFVLGQKDISLKFSVPQALVGRAKDLAVLREIFDRVSAGASEALLVTGEAGIGKSALVNEISKPVASVRGYFISGKYDQLRKFVPYSAIIQAFQGIARQILAESEARLGGWREKLLGALGVNARIITDAISEIALITGEQPPIEALGPEETQNRFNLVFKNFVRVFAAPDHPLVLFLDDLQWADSASLNLISSMMTDRNLSYFLLIGVYRDMEVAPHAPLMITIETIKKSGVPVTSQKLTALSGEDVNALIANFLRCDPAVSAPLARIVYAKTLGNPFFVIQFLKMIYDEKHLSLDAEVGWTWDTPTIGKLQVMDNVVDFMASKIARLPQASLEMIKVCACIGNRFDIPTLCAVTEQSIEEVFRVLDGLIDQGLINFSKNLYRFHHDRIQEAAYWLIAPEDRSPIHYKIGTRLLETTPPEQVFTKLFYIADQFNQAAREVSAADRAIEVAELNLQAGIKAKDASAYALAVNYLKYGMALLPQNAWTDTYRLTYALHLELMECQYLNQRLDESQRLFEEISQKVKSKTDRGKACAAMVVILTHIGHFEEALSLGIESLRMFNMHLTRNPGTLSILREIVRFKFKVRKIGLDHIPNLPQMTDEDALIASEIAASLGLPAYYASANLYALLTFKALDEMFSRGITASSSFGLIAAANIINAAFGDYKEAYRISQTALKLNDQLGKRRYACKVYLVHAYMILHWVRPLDESLALLRKAYDMGMEAGDFIYASHCISAMSMGRLVAGHSIDDVLEEHLRFKDFIASIHDPSVTVEFREVEQICRNLKGQTDSVLSLSSGDFNEEESLAELRQSGSLMNVFHALAKMERTHYLFGSYEEAYRIGFELDTMLDLPQGSVLLTEHYLYRCLSLTAVYPDKDAPEKRRILRTLKKMKKKMSKWAQSCPENYLAKSLLIDADEAAMSDHFEEAASGYQKAIQSAKDHRLTHIEALAYERAARFYTSRGFDLIAQAHWRMAHAAYMRWGADAKTAQLRKDFPALFAPEPRSASLYDSHTATNRPSSPGLSSSLLDLSTIMRVSQTIASEILLDRLLQNIMKIAVENAGAQRGFFILDTDGTLTIEAVQEEGSEEVRVLESLPLAQSEALSTGIVHYVYRSNESVILGNAARSGLFTQDPYIAARRCKSVLCAPVMNKGKTTGVLYMENNLTENAFTPERVELVRLFLGQAAVSLENARLFELATTDGLTKLYVHRYFQRRLEQEISRSLRYDKPFSLIMTDIDNFKHFNDTYGHQLGDDVLRNVARVAKVNLRGEDIAARYGGEEFVFVLPETDMNGALVFAEKIRKRVEEMEIAYRGGALHVTLSLGVATFPHHAKDKDGLIRCADEALYAAKHAGKNRTSVAASAPTGAAVRA